MCAKWCRTAGKKGEVATATSNVRKIHPSLVLVVERGADSLSGMSLPKSYLGRSPFFFLPEIIRFLGMGGMFGFVARVLGIILGAGPPNTSVKSLD